ncbi:MAG: 30S ribosomal protein S9 [Patescibacteria group bacterium]
MQVPVESSAAPQGKYSFAVGRRKTSVARVRLYHGGTGAITVNGKDYRAYFPVRTWQDEVISPLVISGMNDTKDVSVVVLGGGPHSQAGAVRHGISRALLDFDETFRKTLKKVGYLTRDPRMKERKKPGLRRARRAPQWAKR